MSSQEAYEIPAEEEPAEPVRLRLVKPGPEGVEEDVDQEQEEGQEDGRERFDLRAYLPTPRNLRELLAGVGEGTGVLLGRGVAWLRGDAWDGDSALKGGGVLFVCYAAGTAALEQWGTYTGYLIPPAVAVWCLIARQHTALAVAVRTAVKEAKEAEGKRLLAEARKEIAATAKATARHRVGGAPAEEPADTADTVEEAADTTPQQPAPAPAPAPVEEVPELTVQEAAGIIRRVAARHPRHLGVHLSDLLAQPELEGWEQSDLKATLLDLGLPVTSFKLTFPKGPARTREGVRLEHLPQAPVQGAGQAGGRAPATALQGAGAGAGEGPARVPSQPPAGHLPAAPAGTPSGARPAASVSTPSGAVAGVALSPSPTPAPPPSQSTR
ncbi:hypothetical protein [Streptomyces bacillaris]|uniref:hypothetical protein n=1 Tax=Streptomyces bacillaris TaxID=68179 RepID=UPI0034601AF2